MTPTTQSLIHSKPDIIAWLTRSIAAIIDVPTQEISPAITFNRLGLDSAAAVSLTGDLEDWLGRRLDPSLLYDYTTIEALASYLAQPNAD